MSTGREQTRIAIGVPTYRGADRVEQFLTSLTAFTDFAREDYKIVVLDDGTPDPAHAEKLQTVAKRFSADCLISDKNYGIPHAWNRLTEHFDAEYIFIFNDDIQICHPNWLKTAEYFLSNNELVGMVGFPLIHINPATKMPRESVDPSKWGTRPGRVGAAVGCCFGFKQKNWAQIQHIDGSTGFPEYFGSFHEEIDFGFELSTRGLRSYMLHTTPAEHWGSRTFSLNPELAWYQFDDRWISKADYTRIASQCKHTVNFWGGSNGFMHADGRVDRMSYSRILFLKKWGVPEDQIDNPMVWVHHKYVETLPPVNVKWLDEDLRPQEAMVP